MSTPLQPVITKTGLAAIFTADNTGVSARIGSIVLGTSAYAPNADQKSLISQVAEYPIADGERLTSTLLHITALVDGPQAFWVREIGFKLTTGQLLAVWSHPTEVLAFKSADTDLLLAYDLSLAALPADSVTIVSTGAGLSLSLAGPLAAQANALLAEQLRGLKQQDLLADHAQQHRVANGQLAAVLDRLSQAETRQSIDQADLSEQGAALAAGLVAEFLRGLRQQDALDAQAKTQQINTQKIDQNLERIRVVEQRQVTDYDGLVTVAVANASAVISLQLHVTKLTHGA